VQLIGSGARVAALALILSTALPGCSERERSAEPDTNAGESLSPEEKRDRDSLYALGSWLARNLAGIKMDEKDMAPLAEGLSDALLGKPLRVDPVEVGERVQVFLNARRAQTSAEERNLGAALLEAAKQEPGVERTVSGVYMLTLVEGSGPSPTLADQVKIHYRGTLRDGSVFDDSRARGQPGVFRVTGVVPCWMEPLQKMKVGGKAKVTCNADLAYGDRGLPGKVLPGAPLQFELELLEILPTAPAAPPAPAVPATP
jgi:FKBP-type peptidyl-prolyl cis-trans isomerase FkpA